MNARDECIALIKANKPTCYMYRYRNYIK